MHAFVHFTIIQSVSILTDILFKSLAISRGRERACERQRSQVLNELCVTALYNLNYFFFKDKKTKVKL